MSHKNTGQKLHQTIPNTFQILTPSNASQTYFFWLF